MSRRNVAPRVILFVGWVVIVSPVRAHPIDEGEVQDGDGAFFVAFGARPREDSPLRHTLRWIGER